MAKWTPVFAATAVLAALIGFGGFADFAWLGQIVFFLCLVAIMVSLVLAASRHTTH
jgi:uncharacterized membrane protein YtjA (UPF0391 family)